MVARCRECRGARVVDVTKTSTFAGAAPAVRVFADCGTCLGLGRMPSRIERAVALAWTAGVRSWFGMLLAAFPPEQFPNAQRCAIQGGPPGAGRPLSRCLDRLGIARDGDRLHLKPASIVTAVSAIALSAQPSERTMASKKQKPPKEFTVTISVREKDGQKLTVKELRAPQLWQDALDSAGISGSVVQVQAMLIEPKPAD